MVRIIDLTATLGDPGLPANPFFPKITFEPIHTHEVHGRSNTRLCMPIHVGTHIDPPYHFIPSGIRIDELPIERLIGTAVRLDLRSVVKENTAITLTQVQAAVQKLKIDLSNKIPIIQSGWMEKAFGKSIYFVDNPYLAIETAEWLTSQSIKAIGFDHMVDEGFKPGFQPHPGDSPIHRCFLGKGVPLIENLVNLETFSDKEFLLIAMPLKLYRCDGGPARVVAVTGITTLGT